MEAYVKLRRGDSQPGSQAAYRITVRQLEALVRLSEALARLHCRKDVLPAHVREARRLLSESIIAVDARDLTLEQDDGADDDVEDLGPILPDGWFEAHGHTPVEPDEDAGGDAEVGEEGEANADQPGGRGSQDGAHRGRISLGGGCLHPRWGASPALAGSDTLLGPCRPPVSS